MSKRAEKVEVAIEELKDSAPTPDGSGVVLETEVVVDGSRHDTTIEVSQEDVPAVAVALLNTDSAVAPPDQVQPPIRCLGAGVVHSEDPASVRFHLQFDSGQVLPIEMSREAALALCRGLLTHAGGVGVGSVRLAFPPALPPRQPEAQAGGASGADRPDGQGKDTRARPDDAAPGPSDDGATDPKA